MFLGRRAVTNLDSVLENRDIILPTNIHLVKAIVFPVVIYGCESWTIKKAECLRIYAFVLWCWGSLLRVTWTAGRSNQSILKEINSEYSLEGLMLKLQYFGHLTGRASSLEKTLMLGMIGSKRKKEYKVMRWLHSSTNSMDLNWANSRRQWRTEEPGVLQCMGSKTWTKPSDWTAATTWLIHFAVEYKLTKHCKATLLQ